MHDTKEILICPVCGKEMKKIFSKENNLAVDICVDGCGGMFFDNRELKKFDEESENIDFILDVIKDKEYPNYKQNKQINCPFCNAVMVKNYTDINKNTEIDECYSCGGIFLNSGELLKIRSEYKTEKERKEKFNAFFKQKFSEMIKDDINGKNN